MSGYEVRQTERDGYTVLELTDAGRGAAASVLPAVGFNLFHYEVSGISYIVGPPDLMVLAERSSEFGYPILYPPNRVRGGKMRFGDREYRFPLNDGPNHLHGEIRRMPWRIADIGANEADGAYAVAEFRYGDHPELMSYFPHPLVLRITIRLREGAVYMDGEIRNDGTTAAPLALGFHPYFAIHGEAADARITLPAESEYQLDVEGFPDRYPAETPLCEWLRDGLAVSEIPEVPDHRLFKLSDGASECCLVSRSSGTRLTYRFGPEFSYLALFKPPWMNAVSVEPYTCITNAYNLDWPASLTGARTLEPGETYRFYMEAEGEQYGK